MGVGAHWVGVERLPPCEAIGPDGARVVIHPHAATDSVADLARALDVPADMPLAIDDRRVARTERLVAAGLRAGSRISIVAAERAADSNHDRERHRGRSRSRAVVRTMDHAAAGPPHRRAGDDRSGPRRRPGRRVAPRHPRRRRRRDGRIHATDGSLPGDDCGSTMPAGPPRRRRPHDRLESPADRSRHRGPRPDRDRQRRTRRSRPLAPGGAARTDPGGRLASRRTRDPGATDRPPRPTAHHAGRRRRRSARRRCPGGGARPAAVRAVRRGRCGGVARDVGRRRDHRSPRSPSRCCRASACRRRVRACARQRSTCCRT